jgi:drug/metabolite transporter (DMT)-like permease
MQSLWMLVASFFFAGMGVCVKLASLRGYGPAEIVFYRSALSLVLMYVSMRWRGLPLATPHWRFQLQRGVSGFVALSLYFWAITLLPLATAVTLNYTAPIFLALLVFFISRQRPSWGLFAALAMGLAGVAILLRPSLSAAQWFGAVVGLASGVIAALAYFNVRELGERGETEARTVFYFSLLSTVGSLGWLAFSELHPVDFVSGLLLFGVAAFATIAQLTMTRAYKRGRTLLTANLAYTTVVFASLFGDLLWDERLGVSGWLAIALIVLSGILSGRCSRPVVAAANVTAD